MRLDELAFGCHIYSGLTGYDSSLTYLRNATGDRLNPFDATHQMSLFQWLNAWGCRQFSTGHHATVAAPSLVAWANEWLAELPAADVRLENLNEADIERVGNAYGALRLQIAGGRTSKSGVPLNIGYGPVGAAKTLFALRPEVCPPWDSYTLSRLGFDYSAVSYGGYIRLVLAELQGVADQAGVRISELPKLMGRADSTPPKLIDEYYWVTITKGFTVPTRGDLAKWLEWADLV